MKASELRPGQYFKFVDHPTRYRRVKHESRCVYYIDAECQLHWCAPDLEVTPLAVTGWDDEPCEPQGDTPIELLRYGPPPFKRPTLDDLEDAMIDSVDNMSTEEIEAALREAGIDMAPAISKLHAMIEATKATSKVNPAPSTPEPITSTNVLTGETTQWEFATPELREQFVKDASTPEPLTFRAGDWVVCVDVEEDGPSSVNLKVGNVYKVGINYLGDVVIDGMEWYARRFRHATAAEIEQHRSQRTLDAEKDLQPSESRIADAVTAAASLHGSVVTVIQHVYDIATERDRERLKRLVAMLQDVLESKREWPPELVAQVEQKRQDDEGWIEHDGTSMPVKRSTKVLLRIQTLDGRIDDKEIVHDAGAIEWNNTQRGEWKITHYRVVEQPPVRNIRKQPSTPVITGMGGEVQPAKYRPFASAAEFAPHKDRWIQDKNYKPFFTKISSFHDTAIWLASASTGIDWKHLFDKWQFDNGEPCGVRE